MTPVSCVENGVGPLSFAFTALINEARGPESVLGAVTKLSGVFPGGGVVGRNKQLPAHSGTSGRGNSCHR